MGAGQSYKKDERVDIYAQVGKPFYLAGQQLQGNVYLNVKAQTEYDALYIRIKGQQYCYWTQGSGKNRHSYSAKKQSYLDQFIIHKYEGGIVHPGNYTFPFSFIIPQFMSGSFYIGDNNYIKYTLTAYLSSFSQKNENQPYNRQLNIRQLPKVSQGVVQNRRIVVGKCCGCCTNYGSTTVQIRCNKSIVNTGEMIEVEALIDNSKGSQVAQDIILSLQQRHIMTSSGGRANYGHSRSHILNSFAGRKVIPGAIQTFSSKPIIPLAIDLETAVGAITAIWFELTILSTLGCCNYDDPSSCVRLFVYSRNLKTIQPQKMNPPKYWNPVVSPAIFYQGIKPFIYQPCSTIMLLNVHSPNVNSDDPSVNNLNAVNLKSMEMQVNNKYKPSFGNGQKMNQDDPYQSTQYFGQQKHVNY